MSSIKIGKNIIELLTVGMYENPFCAFREYIQNSVDQIDKAVDLGILADRNKGQIHVKISQQERIIEIYDNATGIPSSETWGILTSIAASEKNKAKHRGFRGIGRLGGIAYCKELIFETSYFGEDTKTIVTWDAKKLRSIISDHKNKSDAQEVASNIISTKTESCGINDHYFKVILKGVTNNKLLETADVKNYLKMVSPVPIDNKFIMKQEIYKNFDQECIPLDEYNIYVDTEQIYKPYHSTIYKLVNDAKKRVDEIFDIQFIDFEIDNQRVAYGWYGISTQLQQIPSNNIFRGIRLRKGNIEIGDEHTLRKFFKDGRIHFYFVGEIHVVSPDIVPNGRRDYFDETEQLINFEIQLKNFFNTELHKITYDASSIHSSVKKIDTYQELKQKYEEKIKSNGFVSKSESTEFESKLDKQKEEADKALKIIEKYRDKSKTNDTLGKILTKTVGHDEKELTKKIDSPKTDITKHKIKYQTEQLSKLSKKEQKLVSEIFEEIRKILPPDLSKNLIDKITDKLK